MVSTVSRRKYRTVRVSVRLSAESVLVAAGSLGVWVMAREPAELVLEISRKLSEHALLGSRRSVVEEYEGVAWMDSKCAAHDSSFYSGLDGLSVSAFEAGHTLCTLQLTKNVSGRAQDLG